MGGSGVIHDGGPTEEEAREAAARLAESDNPLSEIAARLEENLS